MTIFNESLEVALPILLKAGAKIEKINSEEDQGVAILYLNGDKIRVEIGGVEDECYMRVMEFATYEVWEIGIRIDNDRCKEESKKKISKTLKNFLKKA